MNQILVTEKIYVTPQLKRKKKLFKLEFFLSVFFICILSSYYIYAEYNRNESEQVSQFILAEMEADNTIKQVDNDVMIIVVDEDKTIETVVPEEKPKTVLTSTYVAPNGKKYSTEARITIPKIKVDYPVLTETSDKLLNISVNKYHGNGPNEVGNYCIVGHNYRNGKMFGRLSELKNGDIAKLEDVTGRTLTYVVYDKYIVLPTDTRCTSQLTKGRKEMTLITCANNGTKRLIVKCREI